MAPGPSCRASIQTSVVSSMNGSGPPSSGDLGYHFQIAQANCSVSHRGVIRGIHFTAVPPGQAKYVVCASGAIIDVVVDLRVGSPTYARWEAVQLDEEARRAVFISESLGHAFVAESPQATVMYLCSTPYSPGIEHGVHPLDHAVGISWPHEVEPLLSAKDAVAPTLAEAERAGPAAGLRRLHGLRSSAARSFQSDGGPEGRSALSAWRAIALTCTRQVPGGPWRGSRPVGTVHGSSDLGCDQARKCSA